MQSWQQHYLDFAKSSQHVAVRLASVSKERCVAAVVFICKLISHLIAVYAYMRFDFERDRLISCLCSLHDLVPYRFEQRSVAIVDRR